MSNKTSDKNVVNIEDDIKLVKRYLENSAYKETDSDFFKNGGWEIVDLTIPKAIEKLLQDYTRQKEINEEHQKINGELRQAINTVEKEKADWIKAYQEEKDSQFELLKRIKELEEENYVQKIQIYENYIPKQDVIDKIEEIIMDKGNRYYYKFLEIRDIQYTIDILRELLEGEK